MMKEENTNIDANLKSVLKNKHGFETPKNYFSEFVDENLHTKLFEETLPKVNGFIVNKDYFNNIEKNILKETLEKKGRIITLKKINRWVSIAAIFVISFCISLFYVNNTSKEVNFDNIAQADIEYWIDNYPLLLSSIEVENLFSDVMLEETNFDFTEISSDAIEEYLLNENIIDGYNDI